MALVCGRLLCTDGLRTLRLRNGCEWLLEDHLSTLSLSLSLSLSLTLSLSLSLSLL